MSDDAVNPRVVERLQHGNWQFGCAGRHRGNGLDPGCPCTMHHHHDEFCPSPTPAELHAAGVDPAGFRAHTRANR